MARVRPLLKLKANLVHLHKDGGRYQKLDLGGVDMETSYIQISDMECWRPGVLETGVLLPFVNLCLLVMCSGCSVQFEV